MISYNQCFTPTSNGRCLNNCLENSNHCNIHNYKAKKLYLRYKNLTDQIKQIDLEKDLGNLLDNIEYYNKCYNLYNKTYEARLKHRKFAIAPNLYDQGHDYQFIDLTNKIIQCEKILYNLYNEYEDEQNKENEEDDEDDEDEENENENNQDNNKLIVYKKNILTLSEKIKIFKRYRFDQEQEDNECLEKYIKENKIIIDRKNLLIYNLCMCISLIFGKKELVCRSKIIAMISLIIKLENIGYFEKNFIPPTCNHPGCNCKISYNFCIGSEFPDDYICFCQFMELFSEDSLKKLFELSLFNKLKIIPFVEDLDKLYDKNDGNIIYMDAELNWLNNRLNLGEFTRDKKLKIRTPSSILANSRLKNKYYERKLINNLL